jgi:hypothetical protein
MKKSELAFEDIFVSSEDMAPGFFPVFVTINATPRRIMIIATTVIAVISSCNMAPPTGQL